MSTAKTEVKTARYVIDLSMVTCPACHRSDRWELIESRDSGVNNPELRVSCDCGQGELLVVIE